jgi:hypothetical protein
MCYSFVSTLGLAIFKKPKGVDYVSEYIGLSILIASLYPRFDSHMDNY